jgi:hypothetical protein
MSNFSVFVDANDVNKQYQKIEDEWFYSFIFFYYKHWKYILYL